MQELIKRMRKTSDEASRGRITLEIEAELCAARFAEYAKGNKFAGQVYFF